MQRFRGCVRRNISIVFGCSTSMPLKRGLSRRFTVAPTVYLGVAQLYSWVMPNYYLGGSEHGMKESGCSISPAVDSVNS